VLFVLNEARTTYPILDLALFRIREFSLTVAGGSIGNMAIVTTIFLSMIWLQNVEGYTTLEAGVAFLAFSLAITIVDQFAGRLGRFPSWAVMASALLVGGVGTTGMGVVSDVPPFVAFSAVSGAGLGLAWAFSSVVTQDVVLPQQAGEASGTVLTVLIGLGGVAIAVASSLVTTTGSDPSALGTAVDRALMAFGLMAVVASPIVAVVGRRFERAQLAVGVS